MDRITTQANQLKQLLTDPNTYGTYKALVITTGQILVETGRLIWLVLCLGLVGFEWFWTTAVGAGRNARLWFDGLQGSSDQIAAETGKALIAAGKNSLDITVAAAKNQLGLPTEPTKKD